MKLFALFSLTAMITSSALAGQQYYYDNNGNLAGSANSFGKQTYYYGPNGEDAGSSMRDVQALASHKNLQATQQHVEQNTEVQRLVVNLK